MSDIKSPLISRTLLIFLANLNNVLVGMISARPPISNSSSRFINLLGIVPDAQITIGITVIIIIIIIIIIIYLKTYNCLQIIGIR